METPIPYPSLPQRIVTFSPPDVLSRYPHPPQNTDPAPNSQPNTPNQNPPSHNNEYKTAPPHTSSTPLLSPFQFQPKTPPPSVLPIPINSSQQLKPQISHPIQILHTFNILHSIPTMPETHPMVLELRHQPLDPQLQLEHELRIIAIEGWHKQPGSLQSLLSRVEEEAKEKEASNERDERFEKEWNTNRQQRQQEELEEAEHDNRKSARWREVRRWLMTSGGSGHVARGKVVKPSAGPRPLLGQGPVKDGAAGYGAMGGGGLPGGLNGGDEHVVGMEGLDWGEGASAGSRSLLDPVPAMTAQGAGHEVDGEVVDAGPWEEIGRQWARIRPWELQ
ncbi:MAG: hypothetical protein L6R42_004671 [Xanthoria sp. 1 TBL-2021]|nr:MAG: hypothetical protein L6R42_004671 [Xanthoria sp. 1 TBL-2021]